MTNPESPDDRRSFASRTPVNDNPDKVVYRRGFVTRHQVTGWRFVMRRIASGVALHDTRMLVDPLRTQTRAVLMGVLMLITALVGCFVFSLIRPNGSAANNPVLADRSTAALYVRVGDQLHPVLNLASARLIAGRPVNPTMVKSSELDKFPLGNLIGIPGAPERMVQNTRKDADWTVCDASPAGPATGVTVIAGAPDSSGARAAALSAGKAVLVSNPTSTWLLWDGRRSRIDLADHAVTSALGLGTDIPAPRPIAVGLFNAIPEAPPLSAPVIPDAGSPPRFGLPVPAPVGAVVEAHGLDSTSANGMLYYAVLPDGLQPISPVLAAVLRNSNSYGLDQPPRLGADQVAKLPVSRQLDTSRYPEQRISLARRCPRSGHLRALEQAGRGEHEFADVAFRFGASDSGRGAHRGSGRRGHRRHRQPGRDGPRYWVLRSDRRTERGVTDRRIAVLDLRHRRPIRHRQRRQRGRRHRARENR